MSALSERQRGEVRAMIDEVMGEGPKADPRLITAIADAVTPLILKRLTAAPKTRGRA